MTEIPTITSSNYEQHNAATWLVGNAFVSGGIEDEPMLPSLATLAAARRISMQDMSNAQGYHQPQPTQTNPMPNNQRRIVQVFIADPDQSVPVEQCLLYKGEPILTELTDQELFFEIPIKELLDKHNEKRVKLLKKTEVPAPMPQYLEKARIRDLKMTVVNIAAF